MGLLQVFFLFPGSYQGLLLPGGAHRCSGLAENSLLALQMHLCDQGGRQDCEGGGSSCCQEPEDQQTSLCPLLAAGPYPLELSSSVLFHFLFGGWLQIILFCLHYTQVLWYKRLAGANMSRLH